MVRTSGVEIGTLLHKIEENEDDSPSITHSIRWMVAFEGVEDDATSDYEEEVSERYMAQLVESSSNESEASNGKKSKTVAAAKRTKGKNGRYHTTANARASTDENGETVVKVKMLTGTLYLYRGMNPRAEFIRIV